MPGGQRQEKEDGTKKKVVKLTEEQEKELEALRNMPDEEIDISDIPESPIDWSKARIAPFYRPKWKDISFRLNDDVISLLESGLVDGQKLDEAANKALRAQMFRIRFPVRVQRAEETVRRIKESLEEIETLYESQKQEIEILYTVPVEEVVSSGASLKLVGQPKGKAGPQYLPVVRDITLKLDENVIDWFEYDLEDGQSLDEAINKALVDHIHWINHSMRMQQGERAAQNPRDSA